MKEVFGVLGVINSTLRFLCFKKGCVKNKERLVWRENESIKCFM